MDLVMGMMLEAEGWHSVHHAEKFSEFSCFYFISKGKLWEEKMETKESLRPRKRGR